MKLSQQQHNRGISYDHSGKVDCLTSSGLAGKEKLQTTEEPARAGTHVIVFLSGQRWLQGPFWSPYLHLQLGDLGTDTKGRKNLATPNLS